MALETTEGGNDLWGIMEPHIKTAYEKGFNAGFIIGFVAAVAFIFAVVYFTNLK